MTREITVITLENIRQSSLRDGDIGPLSVGEVEMRYVAEISSAGSQSYSLQQSGKSRGDSDFPQIICRISFGGLGKWRKLESLRRFAIVGFCHSSEVGVCCLN
jgi:hypothetical protein